MTSRRSLRFRLTAWYAAVLAAVFLVAGLGAWWTMRESIHQTVDRDLRSRLAAMRTYLANQLADPESGSIAEELAEQGALAPAGPRFRLMGKDGNWIYQSEYTKEWPAARQMRDTETFFSGTVRLRILTAPVDIGTLQIGVPIEEFYAMLEGFAHAALIASPLMLLLAAACGYWMSGRALRPVEEMTRTAERIEAENLSERLPVSGAGDELDRLSATLNSMFGRLEASFRRITQFTADASHELRTPVAVIRTTAEVARGKSRTQAEYERALDLILRETERTTRLIEDLMVLARADAGADGTISEPVDVRDVVNEACAEARVLASAAGISIEVAPGPDCRVMGDEHALRRLFLILLDNGIRYNRTGGSVTIAAGIDGGTVEITVRDTGIGIGGEDLPLIFERFYRAAKDRSRQTGGAGLGLSIGKWIAERHGGTIEVASRAGEGSEFLVRIPALCPAPARPLP